MFKTDHHSTAANTGDARRSAAERHLSVTPLDLRQARFASSMRGFSKAEVSAFLLEAADDYEQVLRENDRLRQEVVRLEASLTQFRDLEGSLKSTLLTAQKVADDMRENAAQEAARLVREAEGRAEVLMQKAQARVEDVQREIEGLRLRRREVEANLETMISNLHHTLDFVREQDKRERDDRVVQHRPRMESVRPA
jgi:cell division initiation protein